MSVGELSVNSETILAVRELDFYYGDFLGLKNVSVNRDIALNVYRIVQELLNNVVKHAAATEVLVQATYGDGAFSITVEDNGRGFDTTTQAKGVGWESIRNRVAYLKGSVDVQSTSGKGTSVFIEFKV